MTAEQFFEAYVLYMYGVTACGIPEMQCKQMKAAFFAGIATGVANSAQLTPEVLAWTLSQTQGQVH